MRFFSFHVNANKFIFEEEIDRNTRNERKEKKKWKIFVKFFLFLTFIYKILYFRHRSDLLPVIKKDEVYRYKTSTRIIARATKR